MKGEGETGWVVLGHFNLSQQQTDLSFLDLLYGEEQQHSFKTIHLLINSSTVLLHATSFLYMQFFFLCRLSFFFSSSSVFFLLLLRFFLSPSSFISISLSATLVASHRLQHNFKSLTDQVVASLPQTLSAQVNFRAQHESG